MPQLAPPWPTSTASSAASIYNKTPIVPGTQAALSPLSDSFSKESWVHAKNYSPPGTFAASPPATPRPFTAITFRETFSLSPKSPPFTLNRSVRGWPDPNNAAIRGSDKFSFYPTPRGGASVGLAESISGHRQNPGFA